MVYTLSNQQKLWPAQTAIAISTSPHMPMLLRELVKNYQWSISEIVPSAAEAIALGKQGKGYMFIIDDEPELPAVSIVRELMSDPFACASPKLAFLSDTHVKENQVLAKLNFTESVTKPLTPAKFLPGFRNTIQRWESRTFFIFRQGVYQLMTKNQEGGIKILSKLLNNEDVMHLAAQTIALYYHKVLQRQKDAEQVLLSTLKKSPKNAASLVVLGDIYMNSAMPHLAQRIFAGAAAVFDKSTAINPDLAQAAIMLGDIETAQKYLQEMVVRQHMRDTAMDFLCRLLITDGRETEAEELAKNKQSVLRKIKNAWYEAEQSAFNAA